MQRLSPVALEALGLRRAGSARISNPGQPARRSPHSKPPPSIGRRALWQGFLLVAVLIVAGVGKTQVIGGTTSPWPRNNQAAGSGTGVITTVAGTGASGFSGDGGPAITASLNGPEGVAVDGVGNLYIADTLNHRIRKVTLAGTISTVAGNGVAGFSGDGGAALAASLNSPSGLTIDKAGNLYIADTANQRVRMVNTSGTITTIAGDGAAGFSGDGGPATKASLNNPGDVAIDPLGNLYISDRYNARIRKVATNGAIGTIFSTGKPPVTTPCVNPSTCPAFDIPEGLTADAIGNLYFSECAQGSFTSLYAGLRYGSVKEILANGTGIATIAGNGTPGSGGDGGAATSAALTCPVGVSLDTAGNLHIADPMAQRVRRVDAAAIVSTAAGNGASGFSGDGGPATNASLNSPTGVAADSNGNLYIADSQNNRIRMVSTITTAPVLTSLSPFVVAAGGVAFTLTVNGSNFVSGSVVQWNGAAPATTFVSNTQLTAAIPASDVAAAGTAQVTVVNPGGLASNPLAFSILSPNAPVLTSLSPSVVAAGGVAFTLTVNGSNFVSGSVASVVQWNGAARATTFVSSTQLTAAIPASDVATAGTAQVTVADIGGLQPAILYTSNPLTCSISSSPIPTPALMDLSPSSAAAGGQAFILTVDAYSFGPAYVFVPGSVVEWNGSAVPTTFVNNIQLTAAIPASYIATAGTAQVMVVNPGGGTSNALLFTIQQGPAPGGAFTATGSMTTTRDDHTATLLNTGKVLVAGGFVNGHLTVGASAELYDPATGTFSATGSMTAARRFHTATLLNNGKVLIAGGETGGYYDINIFLASAELYDPATGTFTATGSMTADRNQHTATLLNTGKVLVAGGMVSAGLTPSAELYDPATGTFSATGSMTTGRFAHTATLLANGKVLITGGNGGIPNAELYDPATGTFSATGSMTTPRSSHTAALLNDGQVLVAGGFNGPEVPPYFSSVPVASAELYDPGTGTFTATGSMTTARVWDTATLLTNGMVLIAGDGTSSSAELYDRATGTFTATGSMTTARVWHTATLLNNGQVLIAGGNNGSDLASAELYQPAASLPTISLSPTSLSFTATLGGSNPASQTVAVSNSGSGTLNWTATASTNGGGNWLSVSPTSGTNAGTLTVSVNAGAAPAGSGTYNGSIQVAAPGAANTPQTMVVTLSVINPASQATATLSATSLAFVNQVVGRTSAPQSVTVTNSGTAALTITGIVITGTNSADYAQTNTCGSSVAAGKSCAISVTFTPAATGTRTASISITDNASNSPQTIGLTGTGQAGNAPWAQPYVISTVAGGVAPLTPFPGVNTGISMTGALATDAAGNLYFTGLNYVFRLGRDGVLTRVAGTPAGGFSGDGGLAVNAQLSSPDGVAVDRAGNLYIGDTGNSRIRKVASSGIITTVAGTGTDGYSGDGGPAIQAQIDLSMGDSMATDSAGNLYLSYDGSRIRRISPTGTISTYAGTGIMGSSGDGGPAIDAQLEFTEGLAMDGAGNLYISDSIWIRKVSSDGIITTVAGKGVYGVTGDGGPAIDGELDFPLGLAVDSAGNLYIADYGYNRIRKVSNGVITTVAGNGTQGFSGDNGPASSAQLNRPSGVAVDSAGNLYIADTANLRIRMVSAGGTIATVAGNGTLNYQGDGGPAIAAPLSGSLGIGLDGAGRLYIADGGNNRVRKVLADGTIATVAGTGTAGYSGDGGPASAAELSNPCGIAFDGAGNLYIADESNFVIRKVAPNGTISTVATNSSLGDFGSGGPAAIVTDNSGNIYVNTSLGEYVRKVSANGVVTQLLDGGPFMMGGPNFTWPSQYYGIAVDAAGNLFAADTTYGRVIETTPNGTTTTVVGGGLSYPHGLALDGAANLFIADTGNGLIRAVWGGMIGTVAGNGTAGYSGDGGLATSAQLNGPTGMAMDGSGQIYVVDTGNSAIRLLRPQVQPNGPAILGGGVVNGASFARAPAPVAAGSIVSIFGATLAGGTASAATIPLTQTMLSTQVLINGIAAPLFYVSPSQINAQVPWEVGGASSLIVQVISSGVGSNLVSVPSAPAAPGIFGAGDGSKILHGSDSTLVTASNPAIPGEYLSIYCTGLGAVTNPPASGAAAVTNPLSWTTLTPTVTIGGIPATVSYSGLSPGSVGLYQVNVQVPNNVTGGGAVPVALSAGGASANAATIAVQGSSGN